MTYPDSRHRDPLKLGLLYEDLIELLLLRLYGLKLHFYRTKEQQYAIGESAEGVEVKLDSWISKSRRLSIEIGEKTAIAVRHWTPSGIMRADNTVWYVHGDMRHAWVFKKRDLRAHLTDQRPHVIDNDPPTIQKFYLPVSDSNRLAAYHFSITPSVCDYSMEPVPKWTSCEPCLLFVERQCQSRGASLWRAFRAYKEKEPHE